MRIRNSRPAAAMRPSLWLLGVALAWTSSAWSQTAWILKAPAPDATVSFRGVLNPDAGQSKPGVMLYPAPGLAGFLVAVATHGAIVEASKSSQKQKLVDEADKVVAPFQQSLEKFRQADLFQDALNRAQWGSARTMAGSTTGAGGGWLVEVAPVYSITQDLKAIVLDVAVAMRRDTDAKAGEPLVLRVVSRPHDDEDLTAYWSARDGEPLRDESARLLAHALDVALKAAATPASTQAPAYATVRYLQGGDERMERAAIVDRLCQRIVMRNLRGWMMSVPVQPTAEAAPCEVELAGK